MRVCAVFAVLLLAALLTGCAADWQKGEVVVVQEDKVTVQILAGQSTSDAGSEEMIDRVLRAKFPEVDFQWTCVDWGSAFAPQMTSRFAAGKMPDILIGKAQDVAVYQPLGAILPVEPEACAGVDPEALERVTVDGTIYGLPYNTLYQGVLYQREIFEKLGLDVPRTRQELAHVVEVCEQAGVTPFAVNYGDIWAVGNMTMQLWMNDLFLQYPDWSEGLDKTNSGFMTEPLVRDALEQCRYMREHSFEDAMQINQAECDKRFAQGEAAMYMTGTWTLQTLSQLTPELKIGLFPYPSATGEAGLLEETNLTFMKGNTGKDTDLVDKILLELGSDPVLAGEISEFTTANSTFTDLETDRSVPVLEDGEAYRAGGQVANVAIGNTQFVWPFQVSVAQQTVRWMEGEMKIEELLEYAAKTYPSG